MGCTSSVPVSDSILDKASPIIIKQEEEENTTPPPKHVDEVSSVASSSDSDHVPVLDFPSLFDISTETAPFEIHVREHLLTLTNKVTRIPLRSNGGSYLSIRALQYAFSNEMVVFHHVSPTDDDGTPVAICVVKDTLTKGKLYRIYATSPVYEGQEASTGDSVSIYQQQNRNSGSLTLYKYATLETVQSLTGFSNKKQQRVVFECPTSSSLSSTSSSSSSSCSPTLLIQRHGPVWPKQRIVTTSQRKETLLVQIQGGQDTHNYNEYTITILYNNDTTTANTAITKPIDPCLAICLTALADEMD